MPSRQLLFHYGKQVVNSLSRQRIWFDPGGKARRGRRPARHRHAPRVLSMNCNRDSRRPARIALRRPDLSNTGGNGRSGPDGVGDALLGEAVLGRAVELLFGGGRAAALLGVRLALFHEAVESRSGELLLCGLPLAAVGIGGGGKRTQQNGERELFHRSVPRLV